MTDNILTEIERIIKENERLKNKIDGLETINRNLSMRERLYQSELQKVKTALTKLAENVLTTPHSKDAEYQSVVYGEAQHEKPMDLSYFYPPLWGNKLSEILESSLIHQCTNNEWMGEIKNQGDVVQLHNDEMVITDRKFFAFKISDTPTVQSNEDILEAHLCNASRTIEEVTENFLLSFHADVLKEKIIGSEDNPVELDENNIYEHFANLAIALKNGNAYGEIVGPYVIVNPYIEALLLQSPEFISAHNIKDKTLRKGSIGRIAGMDVLVSTNLEHDDNDNYNVLAGTNDAITFASQLAKIESLRDKDSFSDLVRGLYLYGAKTVQPKALAKMVVKA